MVLINQHHRNPSCGNLRRPHWTLALCVLCGGKGTAPGCAHSVGAQRYQARDESLPTLTGRLKADWIHLPVDDVLALFPTVREGICMGVFRQKAAATWFRPRPTKLQVGRGMGSPIPSLEEGAWTREGPKFVDGGLVWVR